MSKHCKKYVFQISNRCLCDVCVLPGEYLSYVSFQYKLVSDVSFKIPLKD